METQKQPEINNFKSRTIKFNIIVIYMVTALSKKLGPIKLARADKSTDSTISG